MTTDQAPSLQLELMRNEPQLARADQVAVGDADLVQLALEVFRPKIEKTFEFRK